MNRTIVILLMCLMVLPGIAQAELTNSPFNWEIDLTTPISDTPIIGSVVFEDETILYGVDGKDVNYYTTEDGSTLTPGANRVFELEQDGPIVITGDQEDYLLFNKENEYTGLQEPTAWDFKTNYGPAPTYTTWLESSLGKIGTTVTPYNGIGGTNMWATGDPTPLEKMGHITPEIYPVFYGPTPSDRLFNMAFNMRDMQVDPSSGLGSVEMGLYANDDVVPPSITNRFVIGVSLVITTTHGIRYLMLKYDTGTSTTWARAQIDTYTNDANIEIEIDDNVMSGKILDNTGSEIAGLDYGTNPLISHSSTIGAYGYFSMYIPEIVSGYTGYGWRNKIGVGLPSSGTTPATQLYCTGLGITNTSMSTPKSSWDYYASFDGEGGLDSYQFGDEIYYSEVEQAIVCNEHIPYSPGYISSYTYLMPVSYMVSKDFPGNDPVHMTFKIEDIDLGIGGVIRGGLNNPLDPTSFAGFTLRNDAFDGQLEIRPSYNYDIYASSGFTLEVPYEDL